VRFLGHLERCAALIHLVDATSSDVGAEWRTVRGELEAYGGGLAQKPEILALSKIDALDTAGRKAAAAALKKAAKRKPMLVSAVSGEGLTELLRAAFAIVAKIPDTADPAADDETSTEGGWRP
jgi:GTP-binding protein